VTARLHQYTPIERRRTDISLSRQQMSFPLGRGAVAWFDEPHEVYQLIDDLTAAVEAWERHRKALTAHVGLAEYVAAELEPVTTLGRFVAPDFQPKAGA
jgi:hypothetical protein